jgi:hypothetical protein
MKSKTKFPEILYVYAGQWVNDKPIMFGVSTQSDLPEMLDGKPVGVYALSVKRTLRVKKTVE